MVIMGGIVAVISSVAFVNGNIASQKNSPTPTTEITAAGKIDEQVKVIEIEAGSFYFKPAELTLKKGETVKIVLKSVSMMHDFVIDDLNVKLPIVKNGEVGEVEFTADKVGTFEYYCSVGSHRQMGQVGKLVVTE